MVTRELKKIFLSASIPTKERDPKYFETMDIIAIRDAILAITTTVIPEHRLIWGGHPSITPLIYNTMEALAINKLCEQKDWSILSKKKRSDLLTDELKKEIQNHVHLYQSEYFRDVFPSDNEKFENITFTKNMGDIHSSIQEMRIKMISENDFSAAIFVGGMDGIEVEYKMFREKHPEALILPIASTGAATKIVYDTLVSEEIKDPRFEIDYGYMSLFQNLLMDKI